MTSDDRAGFAAARYVSLRTFRRNGSSVDTPLWLAGLDSSLVVFTDGTSWKVKRLRANPRCALALCDLRGNLRGPWREAVARFVDDPAREARAYQVLQAKYGLAMRVLGFFSWIGGRIGRRVVIELELAP